MSLKVCVHSFITLPFFRRLKRHEPQYLGAFSFRPGFSWYTTHPSGLWPLCWVFSSQTRTGGSPQSIKTVGSQLETHSSGWLLLRHVILTVSKEWSFTVPFTFWQVWPTSWFVVSPVRTDYTNQSNMITLEICVFFQYLQKHFIVYTLFLL